MTDLNTLARLKAVTGPKGWSDDTAEIAPHLVEWRGKYQGQTSLLLKPETPAQIAAILAICNETRTPLVAQGGNTGLVGGQLPFNNEILLSLSRLNKIRSVDAAGMNMVVEAGVVLANAQAAAKGADRYFPLSIASEGSATIGGNIATNAGGVHVLRYGSMRDLVLGLEVVLADGRVLDVLQTLRKDNTGYDLKHLFIGSEGTLGVVTAAALKLFSNPSERTTAFVALNNPKSAIELLARLQSATSGAVSAFELLPRLGLEFVLAHIPNTKNPLAQFSPWYVLIETESGRNMTLAQNIEDVLALASEEELVTDAAIAANETQRAAFWQLRESMSEAQKYEGGSIKHDVSVPIRDIPDFITTAIATVERLVPGVRPVPFGHAGDGNIHFNLSVPKGADNSAFLARWEEIQSVVHDIAHHFGGSISAEHGLGIMKVNEIKKYKSTTEMEIMRALKRTFDPNNILNPGKVIVV